MSDTSDQAWRKALLPIVSTVKEAIHCLDSSKLQIGLVIDGSGALVGTITDGDIRRGLLRGLELNSPVESIVQRQAVVVTAQMGRDLVVELMAANKIRQLPIVDSERRVVGLHVWDQINLPVSRPNTMIVMAGGMGKRLRPHTENCPKPLLSVAGKPVLERIVERARTDGFTRFVFAVHYLGHMIEEYFGDGTRFQVSIEYLHENEPLGTAGALSLLDPAPKLPFVVSNGDVLTDIHYGELIDFNDRHDAAATMAVRLHEWQHPFGVVATDGVDIVGFEEKPVSRTYVNAGIYVLQPSALNVLEKAQHCDMPTLFARLQEQGRRTVVYPMHEPWLDIGRPDDLAYARANKHD